MADMNCKGDCMACNVAQRIYCAAQHCHVILENQRTILSQLQELREALTLNDVTSTENDAGAENRASKKSRTSKKEEK